MRFLMLGLLPFISIFLQSTFFSAYSINNSIPDLVLIFVVFFAFLNGEKKGALYGFMCGLFEDLYLGRFIGVSAISKAATGYIVGRLQVRFFNENLLVSLMVVFIGTVINSFIMFILGWTAFSVFNFDTSIISSAIYQSIYNILLAVPVYILYYNSTQRGLLSLTGRDR